SFGRPLGQCCRYCRQHCTGLALRTPGSPLRCLRARKAVPRHAVSFHQSRAQRVPSCVAEALIRALPSSSRRTAPSERAGSPRSASRGNSACGIGTLALVARRGSLVREHSAHGAKAKHEQRTELRAAARTARRVHFVLTHCPRDETNERLAEWSAAEGEIRGHAQA